MDYLITKGGHHINNFTIYVVMDVHKESFQFCAYTIEAKKASHYQRTEADYKNVLKYLEFLRTILEQRSKKRIKTDKRDAKIIAKCLAKHNYSPVHIPTAKDEETKEFLRMRDDHKNAL